MSRRSQPEAKSRNACPLCGKAPDPAHQPFCSQGCRDRDLLNWLGDAYRVPGPPASLPSDHDESGLDSGR